MPEALIEALHQVPGNGKAEIIGGQVVRMNPTGFGPGRFAGKVCISLTVHEERYGGGYVFSGNVGFLVNLPGRQSFSPDAA